jgi:hypothetical protein
MKLEHETLYDAMAILQKRNPAFLFGATFSGKSEVENSCPILRVHV